MAKREIVKVDEDAIKRMIAGDIPIYKPDFGGEAKSKPATGDGQEQAEETDRAPNAKEDTVQGTPRRKKGKEDYREIFLSKPVQAGCRQTTLNLDEANFRAIRKILKTTDGLSMANFINNVLRRHFMEYKEETDAVRKSYMSDLMKDE